MITITRDSKLFKAVQFLSNIPFYSLYIKENYNSGTTYNTFNDICTFTRHCFYTVTLTMLLLFFLFGSIYLLLVFPFVAMATSYVEVIIFSIFILLNIVAYLVMVYMQNKDKNEVYAEKQQKENITKEDSFLRSVLKLISKKHDKFCHILQVKDK